MAQHESIDQSVETPLDKIGEDNPEQGLTESMSLCRQVTSTAGELPRQVWVNSRTSIFHGVNGRWYERTKQGELMSRKEALACGYRAACNGQ